MFGRIFLYELKALIRVRWLVGWNFLFPIVLATAFYLGFGNLINDDPDLFSTIKVGYVNINTNSTDTEFKSVLDDLSTENKNHAQILDVTEYTSLDSAKEALSDALIDGYYIENSEDISIWVLNNSITSTTLTQILKEYKNYRI